ncbi:transglycosylase domain-containing protein [Streptomyces abyssalis]|uniref:Transglycosylase domain-containing protein n=1 Tax=Streptomyces abyssalis TaxID=933944 RepID=A0A1E7JG40_9ACTN|nr:transglycosylase SLT domain-containing protein [Streptomyces abyssalis]OEU85444.1 transglycosylase domain-containing protein [Streptomyces abyssalis]OEU93093.1 transglycosylase domain-containing protein [Streptomyces abyssalis]OEV30759.1 transglycosylase domain-containing protein [Streptomyces nanshensis]
MTRISVRGFAVASATAVTTVGAVVGVASGSQQGQTTNDVEATAADSTLLEDIPAGQQARVQTASLTQQADTMSAAAHAEAKKSAETEARKQAAEDAAAKKAAAEKAAEEREAKAAASRSSARADAGDFPTQSSYSVAEVKSMAQKIVGGGNFQCFSQIVEKESGWNYQASNPSSGAYGLMQALPGSKMSSAGADWRTNPATQIKWGLNYMNDRYGSPCGAWDFWQANNWY